MPSLGGFLKKKRTRDNNPDPSTANPTSPVTATTPSKPFLGGSNPPPSQPTPSAPAQPAGPTSTQPQEPSAGQQPPPPQQQQQMNNTATARQSAPYATAPNLPSISNLIHHDAANHHHHHNNNNHLHPSPNTAMVAPPINKPVSASPGSDAARMLLLQQQAFPMPPGHDAGRQQQAGPQQQQPQQQYHNQPHNQHQSSQGSTPRVTKGKYSLVDFDIMRTLGTGSFGRVHLVQSKHNNRFYAVKVLKKAQVVKMKQVEHTNDERRMLADVKHPFIITLWGTFADCKNLYMVMDFVEGGELFSLLRKSGVSRAPRRPCALGPANQSPSASRTPLPSFTRRRRRWPWNTCTPRTSSTATSSPRICCWIGTVTSKSQTLASPSECPTRLGRFAARPTTLHRKWYRTRATTSRWTGA